jgi:hypothetical protein
MDRWGSNGINLPTFLWRAHVQSGFSESNGRMQRDHKPKRSTVANRISSRRCLGASDPICVLVSRIITAADTQPPHLVLKSCSLKSEALSRSTFAGYPSGRVAQSIDNHAPLSFPER